MNGCQQQFSLLAAASVRHSHCLAVLWCLLFLASAAGADTRYVNVNNATPAPPYTNWATAATNIQDAVDIAEAGDEILVTNGVYETGGRAAYGTMTNRVAVDRAVTVRSVNGPEFSIIQGYQVPGTTNGDGAIRCIYLTNGATLIGFTLTNGATQSEGDLRRDGSGGGLWCESPEALVSNCVLVGNSAQRYGGGAYGGTLNRCNLSRNSVVRGSGGGVCPARLRYCVLSGNTVSLGGGGAHSATLDHCTLTGNAANDGGGAWGCALTNCTVVNNSANSTNGIGGGAWWSRLKNSILYFNTAGFDGANFYPDEFTTLDYCCTLPTPPAGTGNITNAPLFVDLAGGNLRLRSNSPCVNTGNNTYAPGPTDLEGNPRIAGGRVDIGAYEFQGDGLSGFTAWLWQYGLPTDGSADFVDTDGDGHNNWQESLCLTVPTNALSVLRLLSAVPAGNVVVFAWRSVSGVSYSLEWSTNLAGSPGFTPLAAGISGQAGTTIFTHTNAANAPRLFYRIGVGN